MKVSWWTKGLMAGLLACSMVGIADAQPGGGRGGPGGFGGGFGGGGRTQSVISLATNEVIQKELGVNDVIKESLKEISDAYREELTKAMSEGGGLANFRDMSEEERTKAMEKMAETRRTVTNKFLPELKDALTAEQFKRLREIYVQSLRDQVYTDAEVVKALGLKKEQTDKIAEIGKDYSAKMREAFQPGAGGGDGGRPDFQAMRTKMEEMGKDRDTKLGEVLTKDQQAKLKELKGKEFDLAQLQPRGFGGPGGGGPGGAGAGGRPGGDRRPGGEGGRPGGEGGRPGGERRPEGERRPGGEGGRPQGDTPRPKAPVVD